MDYTELMINDWVFNGEVNVQVSTSDLSSFFFGICDPHHISLTPKILELNGFTASPTGDLYLKQDVCDDCLLEVYPSTGAYIFYHQNKKPTDIVTDKIQLHIYYVHQFQQALRMCGFKDLANNLKL